MQRWGIHTIDSKSGWKTVVADVFVTSPSRRGGSSSLLRAADIRQEKGWKLPRSGVQVFQGLWQMMSLLPQKHGFDTVQGVECS